jgi:hypothetical protein
MFIIYEVLKYIGSEIVTLTFLHELLLIGGTVYKPVSCEK